MRGHQKRLGKKGKCLAAISCWGLKQIFQQKIEQALKNAHMTSMHMPTLKTLLTALMDLLQRQGKDGYQKTLKRNQCKER
ncbi:MAG: hypothetical protein EBR68_00165 [Synechococcaceae bacterium WB4_2_0811]|nr:hypothetical protein [Synechococcaceae bacterium WB4_2_0811]